MPFYSRVNSRGYEEVYDASTNRSVNTHTFVARDVYKTEFKTLDEAFCHTQGSVPVVHHKNMSAKSNKLDNVPENLQPMS